MKPAIKVYLLPNREWIVEYRDRMGVRTCVRATGSKHLLREVYDASKKARPAELPPSRPPDEEINLQPMDTR